MDQFAGQDNVLIFYIEPIAGLINYLCFWILGSVWWHWWQRCVYFFCCHVRTIELSLNSTFFVKLTQLAQFNKTSHAWWYMELVIVWGSGGTESSVAYLVEHQTYNPRAWIQLPPSFGQWSKFVANLANLLNLLSRNLGKTPFTLVTMLAISDDRLTTSKICVAVANYELALRHALNRKLLFLVSVMGY